MLALPKDKVPVNKGKQSGSDYRKSALSRNYITRFLSEITCYYPWFLLHLQQFHLDIGFYFQRKPQCTKSNDSIIDSRCVHATVWCFTVPVKQAVRSPVILTLLIIKVKAIFLKTCKLALYFGSLPKI